jgi:hypothetical protein
VFDIAVEHLCPEGRQGHRVGAIQNQIGEASDSRHATNLSDSV